MTVHQVARNAAATRKLADRLARWGLADPEHRAEVIVADLLAEGLAPLPPVERTPRPTGRGSTDEARAQHKAAIDKAIADARAKRENARPPAPADSWQLARLGHLLRLDGMTDRYERLAWAAAMVDRELTSATELTHAEADHLIAALDAASDAAGAADRILAAEHPAQPEFAQQRLGGGEDAPSHARTDQPGRA